MPRIKTKRQAPARDPATDPAEKGEVETLLAVYRPGVPMLIARALDQLPRCKAALELARLDPLNAQDALGENHLGIDGLGRHFHISGNNSDAIDIVVNAYRKLLEKVPRLPLDQAATDYPTFTREAPQLAFNADGTPAKVPAFSAPARFKMFFNPIYRPFDATMKEPFRGLTPDCTAGCATARNVSLLPEHGGRQPGHVEHCAVPQPGAELPAVRDADRTGPSVPVTLVQRCLKSMSFCSRWRPTAWPPKVATSLTRPLTLTREPLTRRPAVVGHDGHLTGSVVDLVQLEGHERYAP